MASPSLRIVSLLPSTTEIVCGIGLQKHLVGISHECNWPPDIGDLPRTTRSNVDSSATSGQIDEQVQTRLQAGKALYEIDENLLIALEPDLIITQAQCDVCAVSYQSVLDTVAGNADLSETKVVALNPTSLAEVLDDIERIGEATGQVDAANQFRLSLQSRIDAVTNRRKPSIRRPRTAVIEWTDPLMVAGNWTPELIELAGGQYGLAAAGEHSRYVQWHQLVDFAPEVLIVAPCGFDLSRAREELKLLAQNPNWRLLPAVFNDRVYAADGDAFFNRPGPRLVDSLEMLARWLTLAAE